MNDKHALPPSREWLAWESSARSHYRDLGNAELAACRESAVYDLAEAPTLPAADRDVTMDLVGSRLRLIDAELTRRLRLHAVDPTLPDPRHREYQEWRNLAERLNGLADCVGMLELGGVRLRRKGQAWVGACPWCAGDDRFVVWDRDSGRRPGCWCRRCGYAADAIAIFRTFVLQNASFFAAVRMLATEHGLGDQVPHFGSLRPVMAPTYAGRRVVDVRAQVHHAQ